MFWGIFGVFLKSLESIFRKKALDVSKRISPYAFDFIGVIFGLIIAIIIYLFGIEGNFDYESKVIIYAFLGCSSWVVSAALMQKVYKNEKLSVITPFENTNEILSIILAFLIFRDVSWTSFFIACLLIICTFLFVVDFKKLTLPKFFLTLIFGQLFLTIYYIFIGLILQSVSVTEYFVLDSIIGFLILGVLVIKQGQIKNIFSQSKMFYKMRLSASFIGYTAFILGLYVISEFGLLMNTLFSFLYVVFAMILSYYFLRDIPKIKNILFALVITSCVGLAFYFR